MTINIKELADQIGVSVSTISRVINGKDRVKTETRAKVTAALEQSGYKPNEIARVLRGKRSNTIGIVVSDISNIFFARIIKGVENEAMANGFDTLVCNSESDPDRERKNVEVLLSKHVSGIVMASVNYETTFECSILNADTPFVFIDNLPKYTEDFNSVSIDNAQAARQLTNYLITHGHTKIALLTGSLAESSGLERLKGWMDAMNSNGLDMPEHWMTTGSFSIDSGFRRMEQLLASKTRPTAVLASNNNIAYGAMLALRQHGYEVPSDFSLAAFDADDETRLIVPKLTTINQPSMEYGRIAVGLCLQQLRNMQEGSFKQQVLPFDLVEGESVANTT